MAGYYPRIYQAVLESHFKECPQMAFVSGPRQCGKTTLARQLGDHYLDWDNVQHAGRVAAGPDEVAAAFGPPALGDRRRTVVFDEIHKFARWKQFLKGFHDSHGGRFAAIVTGSSRLDVYRRGGDSLLGRYFLYRMHPFSVGELVRREMPAEGTVVRPPAGLREADFAALWEHGGFPDPFLRRTGGYSRRWRRQRLDRFLREDLRDLTRVQELAQLDLLAQLLAKRSGAQLIFSALASEVRVAQDTIRRWIETLCSLHYGFLVRPWHRNVSRSLRKEPKWFLRDWSGIVDAGARAETFVACHLLKSVEGWSDLGLGDFRLHYLRDKQQREIDFLVTRDDRPWFLVEVKTAATALSPALDYFQRATGAAHAFQAVIEREFVDADCFGQSRPIVVPARTLLSQLF